MAMRDYCCHIFVFDHKKWHLRSSLALLLFAILSSARVSAASHIPKAIPQFSDLITQQSVEDPAGRAMSNFYESLMRIEGGEASVSRIIHYGDSHVSADILTGSLRQRFQRGFGDVGLGFVLAGRPWTWYGRKGLSSDASRGWHVNGLSQASLRNDGRLGLAGISLTAYQTGEWVSLQANFERCDIYMLKQPGGGAVEIFLDGLPYLSHISLASDTVEPFYVEVTADIEGSHTIELRTLSPGPVRIFGAAIERGARGITYDAMGIDGARANRFFSWDWPLLAEHLERRNPDLIVIAYGANEAGDDLDLKRYGETFSALLLRLREAAPRASLLVISPSDRAERVGSKWRTISRLPALVQAQRKAAQKAGAAFWDMFQAMGGAGSIERWAKLGLARADRVHLTPAGYRLIAESLYKELMRGYLWAMLGDAKKPGRGGAATAVSIWLGSNARPAESMVTSPRLPAFAFGDLIKME